MIHKPKPYTRMQSSQERENTTRINGMDFGKVSTQIREINTMRKVKTLQPALKASVNIKLED